MSEDQPSNIDILAHLMMLPEGTKNQINNELNQDPIVHTELDKAIRQILGEPG